jgi:hypothetical protein
MRKRLEIQRRLSSVASEFKDLSLDVMRFIFESMYGCSQKLAVPVYDPSSGDWSYDPRSLCSDPEEAFREAINNLPKSPFISNNKKNYHTY